MPTSKSDVPACIPERKLPKIRTDNIYPPIPIRQFDWVAWYDGEEDEQMATGSGATEAEAVADLIENHPRTATRGGPTESDPNRPYCNPDQSCCDWCCGN